MQSGIAFGTQNLRDMGTTYGKRVLRWNILGTLPLTGSIHHRHQTHTHVQFGILQAQISHDAILNTSGCPHPSSRQSHNCTGRSYPTSKHDHQSHCATHQYLQDASRERESSRKYPLQFLCDFAYSVLDDKTGDLLEYRHLLKHPKYKDVWSQSFGKEIRRLATVTETIAFVTK